MTDKMTAEEFQEYVKGCNPKANKYHAKKTPVDGVTYDSRMEALRVGQLNMLLRAKEILWWARQPVVKLGDNIELYKLDFVIMDRKGHIWMEDVKGFETDRFKSLKRNWPVFGVYDLHILKRDKGHWLIEIVEPKK